MSENAGADGMTTEHGSDLEATVDELRRQVAELRADIDRLDADLDESRRLNLRAAELLDIVYERLGPADDGGR